uniref:CCHC-type domain-containing protein n=1 Tax=Trichuris muris TaxID=70415 RepID=A0A5S6Q771_TRIMR
MRQCHACEADGHDVGLCPEFAAQTLENRLLAVRRLRLCLICIERGHFKRNCKLFQPCTTESCGGKHHSLLHGASRLFPKHNAESNHGLARNARLLETSVSRAGLAPQVKRPQTTCAVVPARVTYRGVSKQTFALLDSVADVSLMTRQLGDELKMP